MEHKIVVVSCIPRGVERRKHVKEMRNEEWSERDGWIKFESKVFEKNNIFIPLKAIQVEEELREY